MYFTLFDVQSKFGRPIYTGESQCGFGKLKNNCDKVYVQSAKTLENESIETLLILQVPRSFNQPINLVGIRKPTVDGESSCLSLDFFPTNAKSALVQVISKT